MPRLLKFALQYLAIAAFVAIVLYITRDGWSEFQRLRRVTPWTLAALSACFLLLQVSAGLILKQLSTVLGLELAFREWFGLVCVRSLGNYLPLSAGLTANAAYLKLRKDFPISLFATAMAGNLILMVMTGGLLGVAVLAFRFLNTGELHGPLLGLFSAVVALGAFALLAPVPALRGEGRIVSALRSMREGWQMLRSRRRRLGLVLLLHLASLLLAALQFVFAFRDLQVQIDLPAILVLTITANVIGFASLVPGNLGVRESAVAAVANAFGLPFSIGLLAATITRLVNMFWVFVLGTIFSAALASSGQSGRGDGR